MKAFSWLLVVGAVLLFGILPKGAVRALIEDGFLQFLFAWFVLIALMAFAMKSLRAHSQQSWYRFADRLGLEPSLSAAVFRLRGRYRGVAVEIRIRTADHPQPTQTCVQATFERPLPEGTDIVAEGLLDKVFKESRGAQDVEIGAADADAALRIQAQDVAGVKTLLRNAAVRRSVLRFLGARRVERRVSETAVELVKNGEVVRHAELQRLLDEAVDVVLTVERARGPARDRVSPPGPPARERA